MAFKCVLAMVKPNLTDKVVDAAKKSGATGATIIPATGTGMGEAKSFFGLSLDVSTDIIMIVVAEDMVQTILDSVYNAGRFNEPGTGIAFVLPVEQAIGLESQLNSGS